MSSEDVLQLEIVNFYLNLAKNQRLTFYECPNDMNAMIDLSKIADIALVMIDTSVGFEMDTFEFLSLLKNHGYTSVMGVLTHMDEFRVNKSLNKLKKQIKKRFLKEVTDKAKLFYLYGIKNNLYMKMQMHNLARYLKVIKPNQPGFRQNHPYVLADRFDVTFLNSNSEDPEDDVMVSFFGYVRGNNLNKNSTMHIMGLGDYNVDFAIANEDPCPVETVEVNGKKKRTLKQKEKFLYAPYCNINSLEYDRNAGYITIPDKFVTFTKNIGENSKVTLDDGVRIVRDLQDMKKAKLIDEQINDNEFQLFEGIDYEDREVTKKSTQPKTSKNNIDELISNYELKSDPQYYQSNPSDEILRSIYDNISTNEDDEEEVDCYKFNREDYEDDEKDLNFYIKHAKKRFVTGVSFENEANDNGQDDEDSESDKKQSKNKKKFKEQEEEEVEEKNETVFENKTADEQAAILNKIKKDMSPFMNEEFGLFQTGTYVRMDIKRIKRKYVENFRIDSPIVLCTSNIQENSMGFLKIKFSKHIWHPKILKNNDPIILSIGWRKFQTTPIYCVEDKNHRLRMIKYTPKYTSCIAVCYGPLLPINVAVVGIQNYLNDNNSTNFRICGTGDLVEVNQNFEIMKKLKLIGEPMEIYKKTAFIKGMFNSNVN